MLTSALFASDVIINIRFFWIFHKIWAYNCKCDILATNNAMRLVDPSLERYCDPLSGIVMKISYYAIIIAYVSTFFSQFFAKLR